jgi:hypothetical protein
MFVNHQSYTDVNSVYYAVRPSYRGDVRTEIIKLCVTITDGTVVQKDHFVRQYEYMNTKCTEGVCWILSCCDVSKAFL